MLLLNRTFDILAKGIRHENKIIILKMERDKVLLFIVD